MITDLEMATINFSRDSSSLKPDFYVELISIHLQRKKYLYSFNPLDLKLLY